MSVILIVTEESEAVARLLPSLVHMGFACSIASDMEEAAKQVSKQIPDLILMAINGSSSKIQDLPQGTKLKRLPPIIALTDKKALDSLNVGLVDDFIARPYSTKELILRVERVLKRNNNRDDNKRIKCGGLVVDHDRCEVSVEDRSIMLTFREFELLWFLASHKGRVFTRDALLNKVWGYDYFGGDRTVDVHIRRLRSKIDDANHAFIETVRNIGYRFRKNV